MEQQQECSPAWSRGWWLAALAVSLGFALLGTWPVWLEPGQGMLCGVMHPDCAGNQWLLVWVAERAAGFEGLLHNDRYYWPVGDTPFLAGNGGEGLLYLPFHLLLGWPRGANFLSIAVLVGNGLAACWLARGAGARWPGALLATAALGAGPYALRELGAGRFSQADLIWLLLFLGAWLRFLQTPRLRWALLAGGTLAASSALYWYHGLFGVLAGAVLALGAALGAWRAGRRLGAFPWKPWLAFAGSYLLLIAGPLSWYLLHWDAIPGSAEEIFPHPEAVGDSLELALPFLVRGGRFVGQALPATVVLLAMVQLAKLLLGRSDRPWLDGALLLCWASFLALALGPAFSVGGLSPFELLYGLAGPLRRFWWPSRHIVVCNVALCLLAARALPGLGRPWASGLLAGVLVLTVPLSLWLQGPGNRAHSTALVWPPAFYAQLAEEPGEVLLDLPLSPRVALSQKPLLYQLAHGKTLLNGHGLWVDRVRPPGWDGFIADNGFLRGLQGVEDGSLGGDLVFEAEELEGLREQGLALIVLNREHYPLGLAEGVQRQLGVLTTLFGAPFARTPGAWAWRTADWTGATRVPLEPWAPPPGAARREGSVPIDLRTPPSLVFDPPRSP
jgi:hypothetical protein